MNNTELAGKTILIVQADIPTALDLQDILADEGARIVTAYRLERALQLAELQDLAGVLIDNSLCERGCQLRSRLMHRKIPHVVHKSGASAPSALDPHRTFAPIPTVSAIDHLTGLLRHFEATPPRASHDEQGSTGGAGSEFVEHYLSR